MSDSRQNVARAFGLFSPSEVMNLTFLNKLIEKHLRSVVYGGTDGYELIEDQKFEFKSFPNVVNLTTGFLRLSWTSIITIFGIVSGSSGASLGIGVMFIIGLASLCADAISMYAPFCVFRP